MPSAQSEFLLPQVQCTKFAQVFRPLARKFIQQLFQRLALTLTHLRPTIKRLKRASFAELKNHFHSGHPIRSLAVNEMTDDVERAPSIFSLVSERPHFRKAAQKRIESCGGTS